MGNTFKILSFFIAFFWSLQLQAERQTLSWQIEESDQFEARLSFENAVYDPATGLPHVVLRYENRIIDNAYLVNPQYQPISTNESELIQNVDFAYEAVLKVEFYYSEGREISYLDILPFRKNPDNGKIEKLISWELLIIDAMDHSALHQRSGQKLNAANNSVLANGDWFKLGIVESGVYLLNYNYLTSLDASFGGADFSSIRLYGNGGDMLPEKNDEPRIDDLAENPMQEFDQNGNGKMDPGDYLLFYGDATDSWELNDGVFVRNINIYSDTSYYFLTKQGNGALRINSRNSATGSPDHILDNFDERIQHQLDLVNLEKSGREWYGELFDFNLSQNFGFTIPDLVKTEEMCITMNVVARHTPRLTLSNFRLFINGTQIGQDAGIVGVNTGYGQKFNSRTTHSCFIPNSVSLSDNFTANLRYDKNGNVNAKGYLNYLTVQGKRLLKYNGTTLDFRHRITNKGELYRYNLSNAPADLIIWDVTDPINPVRQQYSGSGNQVSFQYNGMDGQMNEFIAFTPGNAVNPLYAKSINNQNIHSHEPRELVIISHPALLPEAQRFKDYKESVMGLSVQLVNTEQIYNEFSSGRQDLSAIRDYLKMLYDRDSTQMENVLLFGDASYDYKYRSSVNTNFVPVYQSEISLHDVNSHSSDDYIAFLQDGLGNWTYDLTGQRSHKLSIGVGRFPVKTLEEARIMVDKVIFYENKRELYSDWLNKITFVADDGDGNLHMQDAEVVANAAKSANPAMNIQKIYVDAYPEISSPSGALTEEGKNALDRAIQEGTLILNYSGHGGEVGWTEEQILRLDQISQWKNYDKLSFFFTATCEFGRYDDPDVVSGGELILLERSGGAIGNMTTTRPVYSSANRSINLAFYNHIFDRENGEQLSLGEVIKRTKNQSENPNNRNFALLGDPSMKLNYPDKKVIVTSINNVNPSIAEDTLKALCLVNIKGEVTDLDSNIISDFNGFVDLKVFDKVLQLNTLGNSGAPFEYSIYKNLLFKGKASIINGRFSVDFVVPKDIDYSLGKGKITAYAYDYQKGIDANGMENRFYVGSSCSDIVADNDPPQIRLFLDDTTFVSGDMTSSSPELIAFLEDDNGINFTGTGIGHDISAAVSALPNERFILNDYYLAELDNYQKGTVVYRLKNLPDGEHTLTLKAWDTHNNSAEETVSFLVASDEQMAIMNVMNYPNPFSSETFFAFDHNRAGDNLTVELRILDRMGRVVKQGTLDVPSSNTVVDGLNYEQFRWDGTNSRNEKLNAGIYFYEIKVKSADRPGEASDIKRLVYIK